MMIKGVREVLRTYLKEHASKQVKLQKSRLLIYDEYLKKYVSADELLIPAVTGKPKEANRQIKSKELFVFDVLIKKFVNPKLDLLIPGIKHLDRLIKSSTSNNLEVIRPTSKDYFWGKKVGKKRAVHPLPTRVHSKTCTETEPPQVGWAGQKTIKPDTDPRPEMAKPECKLGPDKDPKKKKPPKKKSKKNKFLTCSKQKTSDENPTNGIHMTDAEQTSNKTVENSKEIIYNDENCSSDLKANGTQLEAPETTNDVSTPLKSFKKEEVILERLVKETEKNQRNKSGMFKTICSKLFPNKADVKQPTTRERTSEPQNEINKIDAKINTSQNRNEKGNSNSLKECNEDKIASQHETQLKSKQSKALVCTALRPSSLIPSEDSRTTKHYLCKGNKDILANENKIGKTYSEENICLSNTKIDSRREMKQEKLEPFNCKIEEKDKDNTKNIDTCLNKAKVDDCSENNSKKPLSVDTIKTECKKAISKRPNTSPIGASELSKAKNNVTYNNTQCDVSKPKTSSDNVMERSKTACLQKTCTKSGRSAGDGNVKNNNFLQENNKSDQINKNPCTCSSSGKSKLKEMCNETNDSKIQKSPECDIPRNLNIDPKSTEKLQCITQEEFFKRSEPSTDLTKCSTYLGFKVKKQSSKTKITTVKTLKGQKNISKMAPVKEIHSKDKDKSKTVLKTIKSTADCNGILKKPYDSLKPSKSERFLNEEFTNKKSQSCKSLSKKPTIINNVSFPSEKPESKITPGHDSKNKVQCLQNEPSQKNSSKSCSSKGALDVKAVNSKLTEVGENKNVVQDIKKEHHSNQPNEKSSLCTKPSVISDYEDLKESGKYNAGKDVSCCKNLSNEIAHNQDKQICCKKTGKEIDKTCVEKSSTPYDSQPTSDKVTVQCPKVNENTKEITIEKNNIWEQKSAETNKNKKKDKPKDYLKHIITGATKNKKTKLCKKIKSFQGFKTLQNTNKLNKTKIKNTLPKKTQNNEGPLEKIKRSNSAKICSATKSNISIGKKNNKTKSKPSISVKTCKGNLLEHGKTTIKSQKGERLTKLNKLVVRAKCSTASGNRKENPTKHALICSKSTPSIQPVNNNFILGLSKPNKALPKKPSTSNIFDRKSKKTKSSKTEIKNTKMCSLHTKQKRMTELPIQNSKRINVKSFSELKTVHNNPEINIAAQRLRNGNYYPQTNLEMNKEKIINIGNVKDNMATDECELKNTKEKTKQNDLKMTNWDKTALIGNKNSRFSPYLKDYNKFQEFLTSLKHDTEAFKHNPMDVLKIGKNASKSKSIVKSNSKNTLVKGSMNNNKDYSNDNLKIPNGKNQCQRNSISMVPKESTNNVNKHHITNNKNKIFNIQTENVGKNKKEIINSDKKTNVFEGNYKLKSGKLIKNGNISSLCKEDSKEIDCSKGIDKAGGCKNQLHQDSSSTLKPKARYTSNTENKAVGQSVRAKSAAATESFNALSGIPHKTLSPCKTKSVPSFNALYLHDPVPKYAIKPLRYQKKGTNKDFEIKSVDSKISQNEKGITSQLLFPNNNLATTKYERATSSENKMTQIHEKSDVDKKVLENRKLQQAQVNEAKRMDKKIDSIGQTNKIRNNVSNEMILCDFIENAFDVNVHNLRPQTQRLENNKNSVLCQNFKYQVDKESNIKQCVITGGNNLKHDDIKKKECRKATKSLTNDTLLDGVQSQVLKLETIIPSTNKIFNPVHLNRVVSIGNNNQEIKKHTVAVNLSVKDKTFERTENEVPKTEIKEVKENSNIRHRKSNVVNQTVSLRKISASNIVIKPMNTEKLKEIASAKCITNTQKPELKKDGIKKIIVLKQPIPTTVKSKYSPTLKTNKIKLISKRHRKFINLNNKKTPLTVAKLDSEIHEKSESKERVNTQSGVLQESINGEKQGKNLTVTASLSLKQSRLLMDQPFYKKPKAEKSTDNALHISKPATSFVASNDNNKSILPPQKPDGQLGLVTEQPFNKQLKSESTTENLSCNSKSGKDISKPQRWTQNELQSCMSDIKTIAFNKDGVSAREQPNSIRSQLLRKTPAKAVIQINLNKIKKDK